MKRNPTKFDRWIAQHGSDPEFVTAQVLMDFTGQLSRELARQGMSRSDLARVLNVDRAQVSRILNGHPNMTVKTIVKAALALGFRPELRLADQSKASAEDSLLQHSTLPIRTRLAHLLLTLKHRYGFVDEDGTTIIRQPMQRQDMAALLGTRPETLARAFQSMRQDGILKSSGRNVIIPDLDGLLDEIRSSWDNAGSEVRN
jgi:CRP-like cAMP-binding protein